MGFFVSQELFGVKNSMFEFKPVGKKINKKEKEFLLSIGKRWCGCCKTVKLFEDFHKANRTCKLCQKIKSDHWRLINKDEFNSVKQAWRHANAERERGYNQKYREANQQKIQESDRARYQEKKDSILQKKRENYQKRKDILNDRRREKRKEQMKDPLFATAKRLRDRIRGIFKRLGSPKNSTTQKLIGCDWLTAKEHLEKQFTEGMSWENMGQWHIDHKIPLASASTIEELISLFHYTNLQPLWAFDNMSKGAKLH
jgi:hypothetical protein